MFSTTTTTSTTNNQKKKRNIEQVEIIINDNNTISNQTKKSKLLDLHERTLRFFELVLESDDEQRQKSLKEIEQLLAEGIDLKQQQQQWSMFGNVMNTPLMAAIYWRRLDVVKLLLSTTSSKRNKFDLLSFIGENGQCAVTFAATVCKNDAEPLPREIFKYLIEQQIDNFDRYVGANGETALMMLARDETLDLIDELLMVANNKHVNINAVDSFGNNALVYAFYRRQPFTLGNSSRRKAPFRSSHTIKHLIDLGVDVDHRNQRGETALHLTALTGALWAAEQLIECGANPTIIDRDGKTPLQRTSSRYNVALQMCLQEAERKWDV